MPNSYAIIGRRARPGLSENLVIVRESIPCFSYFYHLNSFILLIFTWILKINYGEIDGGRSTLLTNS